VTDLEEFQRAAVSRICDQLERGSHRFLLADEVGLGKTMVARGVVEELRRRHRDRNVCIYLCSNLEIAEQNRDKLLGEATEKPSSGPSAIRRDTRIRPDGGKGRKPPTRLTLIPIEAAAISRARKGRQLQLFVFTPHTSLHLVGATGIKAERRMLLACLYGWRPHRLGAQLARWKEFFRCEAGQRSDTARESWNASCDPIQLRRAVGAMKESGLYRRLIARWRHAKVDVQFEGEKVPSRRYLLDALYMAVAELSESRKPDRRIRRNRNAIIGTLRKGVAEAAIDFLAPDIVLVDEFQRFKEVIELAGDREELACRLFEGTRRPPRVLVLSATPYKAVTFDHEQEDHYRDFRQTLSFLLARRPGKEEWLEQVDKLLREFKDGLTADSVAFDQLIRCKDELERRLREVMCRTERNRYIFDEHKGIEERPDFYKREGLPTTDVEALAEFVALRSFLQKHEKSGRPFPSIIDFWKSCSSIVSFMDAGYVLINRLKKQKARIDPRLLRQESEFKRLGDRNLKVRTLLSRISESAGAAENRRWRFLWTRPSYLYYHDEFFGNDDPAKFLVFSRWRFVPKAISFVVSGEFEPMSAQHRKPRKQPLELNSECLKVCAPFLSLADIVDPATWSSSMRSDERGPRSTAAQLRRHVRVELRRRLAAAGITIEPRAPQKAYWPALFALERYHLRQRQATMAAPDMQALADWEDILPEAIDIEASEAQAFLDRVRPWIESGRDATEERIVFPASLLDEAVTLALGSPAICLTRAIRSLFDDGAIAGLRLIARTCFQQLRAFFNKGYVQTIVRRHARSGRYADQVLRYCFDAQFQAVIDEYAYLVRKVLQRADLPAFLEHVGRVLAVGAGTPNINVPTRGGRIGEKRAQRPVHFALTFGEENQPDESVENRASRKTSVREAFNSPFWPFVLATTSVGQEGLDFHLYCRDVMHWNLPSNPVDLEQREGRINRFDGLVVRRNVAIDYPLTSIAASDAPRENIWVRIFREVVDRPTGRQHLKHGLFPHWVFEPSRGGPVRIRRHLAIFEGSRDRSHYERLKKYLFYYRLAFGQARQQDLLDKIVDRADEDRLRQDLQACMINLSPIDGAYSWKKAQKEAVRLIDNPERLRMLIEETKAMFSVRHSELHEVSADLDILWKRAERILARGSRKAPEDVGSVAALVYLHDPFDEKFDGLVGYGLMDDVRIIREASRMGMVGTEVMEPAEAGAIDQSQLIPEAKLLNSRRERAD
jgi:hypothetical protein